MDQEQHIRGLANRIPSAAGHLSAEVRARGVETYVHEIHQKILDEFDSYNRKDKKPNKKADLQQFRPHKHPNYREKLGNNLTFFR